MGEVSKLLMDPVRSASTRVLRDDVKATAIHQHLREIATTLCVSGVLSSDFMKWVNSVTIIIRTKAREQQAVYPDRWFESNADVACDLMHQWGSLAQTHRIISPEVSTLLTEIITRQSSWVANHLVAIMPDVTYWHTIFTLSS